MDFALSAQAQETSENMWDFMVNHVFPAEPVWHAYLAEHGAHATPPVIEDLKAEARRRGLWNLFLPRLSGMTNLEYAAIAEISGWSPVIAPEAINCQAPDTGNMETLDLFATAEQRERWLDPLLEGRIRSAFAMTEPDVASSDATNVELSIVRDGDDYVINGRKWWITGAMSPNAKIFIVMGKTDPTADRHRHALALAVQIRPDTVTGHRLLRRRHRRLPEPRSCAGPGEAVLLGAPGLPDAACRGPGGDPVVVLRGRGPDRSRGPRLSGIGGGNGCPGR